MMASASTVSEGKQSLQRRKSCDTVCSTNSSCFLHKRKPVHPLANTIRAHVSKTNGTNAVRQRVLSARLLKLRSLQNQLNDANFHLSELQQENRALRNLQTRQDRALSRYEGANADLPKLIKSHEEDIRVLTTKNKALRKALKEVADQLKIKEDELASVREQLKNLTSLSKNKNLGERQALAEQVEDLKLKLKGSDDKINLLNRKVLLETKNYKYKLNAEISKNKQMQKELSHALTEVDRLTVLLEAKGKIFPSGRKRFAAVNQRSSISLINLTEEKSANKHPHQLNDYVEDSNVATNTTVQNKSIDSDIDNQSDQSDIKLEPIANETKTYPPSDIMVSPSDSVKARLSSNSILKCTDVEQLTKSIEKIYLLEDSYSEDILTVNTSIINQASRPSSSHKLEKLPSSEVYAAKSPATINPKEEEIEQRLGGYHSEVLSKVKDCNAVVDKHRNSFESVKSETEKLLESLRETDAVNSKLRYSNFLSREKLNIPEKDLDLASKIFKDEYAFQKEMNHKDEMKNGNFMKADRNGNVVNKELDVAITNKNKLLATLRAIDNGEEIEDINYNSSGSNRKVKLVE